jgi:hypothetical protein
MKTKESQMEGWKKNKENGRKGGKITKERRKERKQELCNDFMCSRRFIMKGATHTCSYEATHNVPLTPSITTRLILIALELAIDVSIRIRQMSLLTSCSQQSSCRTQITIRERFTRGHAFIKKSILWRWRGNVPNWQCLHPAIIHTLPATTNSLRIESALWF